MFYSGILDLDPYRIGEAISDLPDGMRNQTLTCWKMWRIEKRYACLVQ